MVAGRVYSFIGLLFCCQPAQRVIFPLIQSLLNLGKTINKKHAKGKIIGSRVPQFLQSAMCLSKREKRSFNNGFMRF